MSNVRAPQFVVDIVSDLRDRHLLIPAGLLLLALLAVPFLLSSATEQPPPPPVSAAAALDTGEEAQPAVLTENVTVRDYRDRLDELKSTNPFESGFAPPEAAAAAAAAGALDDLAPPGGAQATGGATTIPAGGDTGVAPTGSTSSSSPSPSTSTSSSGSGGSGGGSGGGGARYYTYEINVKTGETGDLTTRKGVQDLTLLPKDSKPVVMFLGVNRGGNRAVFLVSEDVTSTSGDGACAPSGSNCDFLTLQKGEEQTFDYAPDGKIYKLVLKDINSVRLNKAPDTKAP